MYNEYITSLKERLNSMSIAERIKLLKILERKNGLTFPSDDEVTGILKHLYVLSISDANYIISKYIMRPSKKSLIKHRINWSGIMFKFKINEEVLAVLIIAIIGFSIIFFGLKSL